MAYYPYIKSWDCPNIEDNAVIKFHMSDGDCIKGRVIKSHNGFFVSVLNMMSIIGLKNPIEFFSSIVGWEVISSGAWPFVQGRDNFIKVLNALTHYRSDRIPEDQKVIISDDEEKRPFTLSVMNNHKPSLNFKI